MPFKYPRKKKEYDDNYHQKNKIKINKRSADWRRDNHQKFLDDLTDWREKHKQQIRDASNKYHKKLKRIVIEHYSSRTMRCACENCYYHINDCPMEFLSIDHINGGGNAHRRQLKTRNGWAFYLWLIKNNFPEGFRVLCFNCNLSEGFFGYCPHNNVGEHNEQKSA